MDKADSVKSATMLLGMIEGIAVSAFGEKARYNPIEKLLLETSIPEMVGSMDTEAVEQMAKVLYPLVAITGFSIYGLRLFTLSKEQQAQQKKEKEREYPPQEPNPVEAETSDIWNSTPNRREIANAVRGV